MSLDLRMKPLATSAFPALAEPTVRRYLIGQFCSVMGSWTQNITLSLLMWNLTHSGALIGLLNFLLTAPMIVLPLVAGAKQHPSTARRDTLRILACSFSVAVLLLTGEMLNALSPTALLVGAAFLGVIGSLEVPARQLLLTSSLANKSLLPNAVAMNTLVYNIGRMVGPAVAALAFAHGGATAGFAVNAFGLAIMLLSVSGFSKNAISNDIDLHKRGALKDALALCRKDPFMRQYLPLLVGLGIFVGSYQTLIPVLSAKEFGSAAKFTGVFFGCAGAGALCAAVILATRPAAPIWNRFLANAPWVSAAALTGIAISQFSVVSGICFWVLGLSLSFTTTRINATLQRRSPDHLRGSAVGLYAVCFLGTMPIGHLLVGGSSGFWGPRWTSVGMALCLTGIQLLLRRRRSKKLKT